MNQLSEKKYWDNVIEKKSVNFGEVSKLPIIKNIALWFYNWEFFRICKKYIKSEYKTSFEVGCAPGNYLIQLYRFFSLTPCGVEYSKVWVDSIIKNFSLNHIDASGIVLWDFFDPTFIKENTEKYDVVYSMGFIEHFDNPQEAIDNHFHLAKKWGIVVITLPNLYYLNKYFVEKSFLDIHNLNIMRTDLLAPYFTWREVLENRYFWGFFNFWGFIFSNPILEKLRLVFFVLQRIIIDPILMVLSRIWINLSNRYTSPSMIIVCRKN
jgi:SAM-dependent methyltransferase